MNEAQKNANGAQQSANEIFALATKDNQEREKISAKNARARRRGNS